MITIHNLEVRFDVEGETDEQTFIRMFDKYIRLWHRQQLEQSARRYASEHDRILGDRPPEGY